MRRDNIFISYSRKDLKWLQLIKERLVLLEHMQEHLEVWDDSKIKVGTDWKKEIARSIKKCRIAILLVSNNFLASTFILKDELPNILTGAREEGLTVFTILLDTCAYHLTPLAKFQCLNADQPLSELPTPELNRVLVNMVNALWEMMRTTAPGDNGNESEDLEDANIFHSIIVLAHLIKDGPQTISELQTAIGLERKAIVSALDKLQTGKMAAKSKGVDKKNRPSSVWKALPLGMDHFYEFETLFARVNNATR